MDASSFSRSSPGRLIKNLEGRLTFLPDPLPPELSYPPSLLKKVSEVSNALGRLDGIASSLPDQRILIRSFVRREAQLSSYIENTYAAYDEVAAAIRGTHSARAEHIHARETANAEDAINAGVAQVFENAQPVTLSLIRQLHQRLLTNVRGHEARGRFRSCQVYIGSEHEDPDLARFVPPPSTHLQDLTEQFGDYLKGNDQLPALIQIALLHYQFETIHPFQDGNGRIGRILILLGLCQHRLLSVPLLNASLYFERKRRQYYDALLSVSTHGDWLHWINFFVEGLNVAVSESLLKLRELTQLKQQYHEHLMQTRTSSLLIKFVNNLFINPVVTIADAAEMMDVSFEAARLNVRKLVEAGILNVRSPGRPVVYVAETILKAVNPEPTRR